MSANIMFFKAISKVITYFKQENNSRIHSHYYQKDPLMLQHQAIHSAIVGVAIPTLRISKRLAAKTEGKKH